MDVDEAFVCTDLQCEAFFICLSLLRMGQPLKIFLFKNVAVKHNFLVLVLVHFDDCLLVSIFRKMFAMSTIWAVFRISWFTEYWCIEHSFEKNQGCLVRRKNWNWFLDYIFNRTKFKVFLPPVLFLVKTIKVLRICQKFH